MLRRWLIALVLAVPAGAQDTSRTRATPPAPQPKVDISGVIFANFQSGGTRANREQNRFDVERVYLNFQAPAGDRMSVRFTSDLYVQRDSTRDQFYRGWTLRAKYAWLQYDLLRPRPSGAAAVVRLGLVHTPIAEYEEGFFLRYVSAGSLEPAGFFSTADGGLGTLVTLPSQRGELYFAILNGPGYTSREVDRFKDFGARLSLTPFASRGTGSFWSSLSLTPWFYKGRRASTAASSVGDARRRDRYGFFAGLRDPRLRAGLMLARRSDESETAPGTPVATSGSVVSVFTVAKPWALVDPGHPGRAGVILRVDQVRPDVDAAPHARFLIAGLQYEVNPRSAVSLDMQLSRPRDGSRIADSRTGYLHLVANF